MHLTEANLQMIEEMGATGFLPAEIAEVLEVERDVFLEEFSSKGTVYKRYRKGFLHAQFILRRRIFKDAGFGSSPAQTLGKKILDDCEFKLSADA